MKNLDNSMPTSLEITIANRFLIFSTFILNAFFLINCIIKSSNLFIVLIIFVLISDVIISIVKRNYVLLLFLFTFTFFQLSRILLYFLGVSELNWNRGYVGDSFNNEVCLFILKLDYIVLTGINISFWIKRNVDKKQGFSKKEFSINGINSKIAFFLYCMTIFASIFQNILAYRFVQANGYVAYYKDFHPPYLIMVIAGFSKIYFYLYICVSKKISKIVLILYCINMVTSIITGVRSEFVLSLMLLLFIYWNRKRNFSFRNLLKFIIPGICLFVLLFFSAGFKSKDLIKGVKAKDIFVYFLDSQGVSLVIPGYVKEYEDDIPDKGIAYLFPKQINVFQNITKTKFTDRKDEAINGFYISKYISYRVLGRRYENGEGMGGAFHADLYHIFGFFGVFIFSVFLGIFSIKLSDIKGGNFRYLILLSLIYWLFYIPRAQPLDILGELFSIKFWIAIFGYLSILKLLTLQKEEGQKNGY